MHVKLNYQIITTHMIEQNVNYDKKHTYTSTVHTGGPDKRKGQNVKLHTQQLHTLQN